MVSFNLLLGLPKDFFSIMSIVFYLSWSFDDKVRDPKEI